MERIRNRTRRVRSIITFLVVGGALASVLTSSASYFGQERAGIKARLDPRIRFSHARRVQLFTTSIVAAGRALSSNSTVIRCALMRLSSPGAGGTVSSNGASTILSLVPDGTQVKEGDLLCELDASEFVELVRRQTIGVRKAEAEHLQAELNLAIAEIGLTSYLEGTVKQSQQQFEGQLALNRSSLSRQEDRLAWTHRMLEKGYTSISQLSAEEEALMRLKITIEQVQMSYDNFRRYTVPRETRSLKSRVEGAKSNLIYQATRLKLERERLEMFETQVRNCSIRAPHDGFLIYNNDPGKPLEVYEGAPVRQRQRLFSLPDLSRMEVQAMIHETVVDKIRPEMPAKVRFEALPGRVAEGHVLSVSRLPLIDDNSRATDVKYYSAIVKLDELPIGLRPGMSAEIEITTSHLPEALVIPTVAVARDGEQSYCYVLTESGLDRRAVKLGGRNQNLMHVLEGLSEGEQIILDPQPEEWNLAEALSSDNQVGI